jgi:serine/threonine protein kinase
MLLGEIVSGQLHGWSIKAKLGEGDAGEVFLVESLAGGDQAILKRPRKSAFSSEIIRQANQIQSEGRLLQAMKGVGITSQDITVRTPIFIDSSKPGTEFSERFFIIIEKAPGINLLEMANQLRGAKVNLPPAFNQSTNTREIIFLQAILDQQSIPDYLLARVCLAVLDLFDFIHHYPVNFAGQEAEGIIWNDVKPEHLFWEPDSCLLTVIDWGNGKLLTSGGITQDRRFSVMDDFSQYLQGLGSFLEQINPGLYSSLDWPSDPSQAGQVIHSVSILKQKLLSLFAHENSRLQLQRNLEETLVQSGNPSFETWDELEKCQNQIKSMGELPDWVGAEKLAVQMAAGFVHKGDRNRLEDICQKASSIPGVNPARWEIVKKIIHLNLWPTLFELAGQQALLSAIEQDWPGTLWFLRLAAGEVHTREWWPNLCDQVRQAQPEIGKNSLTPLVTINRLIYTLQSRVMKKTPVMVNEIFLLENENTTPTAPDVENLVDILKNTIARRWVEAEPDPPNSGLEYNEIEEQLDWIGSIEPAGKEDLARVLNQPIALVNFVLDCWGRREFETARRGLRKLFLWDPDRQRVFLADLAIAKAASWLANIQNGPEGDESLLEFIARNELRGREMRNQVGAATWLDQCLGALNKLRKGGSPADILLEFPSLRSELPWLLNYHPPRLRPFTGPVLLERKFDGVTTAWKLSGTRYGPLGQGGELILGHPLDTWASEARGSSARVFDGKLRSENQDYFEAAIKIMRPGKADYALPLFQEEVQILTLMKDVPGVKGPYEFGFIHLENHNSLPEDETSQTADGLLGEVFRITAQDIRAFISEIHQRTDSGWLPYIALPIEEKKNNLIFLCDSGYTHGRFLSLKENLRMAIQILDILQIAHSRNIVYRDHKILHYYWTDRENGITIIDWNVARRAAQGLSLAERGADLVQFSARALHHILTGRPAPGALPVGPTRPDEIDQAANVYTPQWTFDDQRLPTRLKEIIQQALAGYYHQPSSLKEELTSLFYDLPDEA